METLLTLVLFIMSQLFGMNIPAPVDPTTPDNAIEVAQVVKVIDGDTIVVSIDGAEETVRYIGIDTPEPYRDGEPACYSAEASARNAQLVAGQSVELVADVEDRDRYDRLLRYVYVDDVMINEILIAEGYATTLSIEPNTALADGFAQAQATAQTQQLGLWHYCQSAADGLTITPGAETESEDEVILTSDQFTLTPEQERLLEIGGIDALSLTITADMVACAEESLGVERIAKIVTGQVPTVFEAIKLARCY